MLHTPGHTPEHLSFLIYEGEQSRETPALLLSGGALLVGDLARPDLLGGESETREAAHTFCATLQHTILDLPDHVLVYPTHVAGSLCGGAIGARLVTTVGYERRANAVLREVNDDGVIVVDTRAPEAVAGGHIPGALNVGWRSSFPTWAGTVLPEDADTILVLDDEARLLDTTWELLRIGYPPPHGHLHGGMRNWRTSGRGMARVPTVSVHDIREDLDRYHVLDVRQPAEWVEGHAPGAQFLTGAELADRHHEVPRDRTVLTVCGSGYRSSVAASYLQREGHDRIVNLLGGMSAWLADGLPVDTDDA